MTTPCPHCDQTTPHTIEKYCPHCEKTLPHTAFYKNKAQPSGLTSYCKACTNATHQTPEALAKRRQRRAAAPTNHRIGRPPSLPRDEAGNLLLTEKYCPQCQVTKPRSAFHKNASQPDGLHGWCKACRNAIHLQPEEQAKRQRLHRSWYEDNREHSCAYAQQWRLENLERTKETEKQYLAVPANKRKKNARRRERYRENPSKPLAACKRRRARIKQAPINDLTAEQWEATKQAYDFRCVYCPPDCKACRRKTHKLTQEHLTPLSKGGSHTVTNVVPACHSCNTRRQNGNVLKPVQPLLLL